jgi:hypothetical protein
VAEADLLGALAGGGEEDLRLGGVGILFEEVVFDLPGVVVTEFVGQFDLGQGVLVELLLGVWFPGAGTLQFVKDTEFHGSYSQRLATGG